MIKIGVVVDCG